MIAAEHSRTIEALRFPLAFCVIMIHASGTEILYSDGSLSAPEGFISLLIQNLFSGVLAQVAVPLFFLISGLLFFREGQLTLALIKSKWKKRIRTLLVPFLLWNAIVLLVQIVGQSVPYTKKFFSGQIFDVHNVSVYAVADSLLGFDKGPVNCPLWFLRDLILLVIISPAIFWLLRSTRGWAIAVFFLFWSDVIPGKYFLPVVSPVSVLFFSLGANFSAGINNPLHFASSRPVFSICIAFIYAISACIEAYFRAKGTSMFIVGKINILLGMYSLWHIAGRLIRTERAGGFLISLGSSAFFVYLAHGQVLQFFKKISYRILQPGNDLAVILVYFLTSLLTASALACTYFFLKHHFPQLFGILTGRDLTHWSRSSRTRDDAFSLAGHKQEAGYRRVWAQKA